jgi:hypothetical protein
MEGIIPKQTLYVKNLCDKLPVTGACPLCKAFVIIFGCLQLSWQRPPHFQADEGHTIRVRFHFFRHIFRFNASSLAPRVP